MIFDFSAGSALRSVDVDFDWYSKRELHPDFHLYWRILKDEQEIEVILVTNGTGYAAIGWRPNDIGPTCKNFPEIGDPHHFKDGTPSGKPEPEPETEPEPKSEPEPEPKSEPEPEPKSEPEPEPKSEPEPEPKSEPEPAPQQQRTSATNKQYARPNRQKSVSSRATKSNENNKGTESVETSVSYRISASRGKRETRKFSGELKKQVMPQKV